MSPYPGWSPSDVDQYTSIISSVTSDPKYKGYSHDRVQKLAASIVNKKRMAAGRTKRQLKSEEKTGEPS